MGTIVSVLDRDAVWFEADPDSRKLVFRSAPIWNIGWLIGLAVGVGLSYCRIT